ncbi:MAG: lamin tail domain-containing protein, partial [Candidatus Harrisonbacteria bacterium]|nr:lamin tail domain-containing protein [Candidatus Harrisonbacteria bacterium]
MENRKFVKLKFALASLVLLNLISPTFASRAYAYEIGTHRGITKEIVRFYNANFSQRNIGDAETAAMLQGSKDEDDAPRWMNHFYDPVYNRGLTNFFGTNWMSSKQWAQNSNEQIGALYNPIHQVTYSAVLTFAHPELLTQTDYTWRRSLEDYASGDTKRAFEGLGHVLHLLEDASVPDHTRNDPHPAVGEKDYLETGSPYELWTMQFNENNINLLQYLYTKKPIALDSLNAYFDAMANYSNKNFYSRDTIDGREYSEPKPDYILRSGKQVYGYKRDADGDFRLVAFGADIPEMEWARPTSKSASLKDGQGDHILRDYWERLAPKAVQYGAGLVQLFLQEAEKLKNDPTFVKEAPKPLLAQVVDAVRGFFTRASDDVAGDGLHEAVVIPLGGASGENVIAAPNAGWIPGQARNDNASVAVNPAQGRNDNSRVQVRNGSVGTVTNSDWIPGQARNDNRSAPAQLAQAQTPAVPASEYRPTLAPPKPSRFANAVGGEHNVSTNAASVPTQCAYATAASPARSHLIFNEIAWMGSQQSSSDEWMELKNISGGVLDVSGWQVVDKADQIHATLPPATAIPAGGLYLLERTNDDTVPNVKADFVYTGGLGNTSEGLRLFDNNCVLQDEVLGNPWPAGEASTKRTMERAADLLWYTSSGNTNGILGTPKMENSQRQDAQWNLSRAGLGSAPPTGTAEPPPAAASVAATHVVISEIQAGTDGNSDNEFIELYNPTA